MSDTNDIVTNLRSVSRFDCTGGLVERAADKIDRLRAEVNDLFAAVAAFKAEVAQRTAERDEARRIACDADAAYRMSGWSDQQYYPSLAREIATERGWNCFAEEEER